MTYVKASYRLIIVIIGCSPLMAFYAVGIVKVMLFIGLA